MDDIIFFLEIMVYVIMAIMTGFTVLYIYVLSIRKDEEKAKLNYNKMNARTTNKDPRYDDDYIDLSDKENKYDEIENDEDDDEDGPIKNFR